MLPACLRQIPRLPTAGPQLWMALAVISSGRAPEALTEMELDEPEFWSLSGAPHPPEMRLRPLMSTHCMIAEPSICPAGPETAGLLTGKSELANVVFRLVMTRLELAAKGVALAPHFAVTPLLT
jgi:hypothetical protein